MPRIHPKIPYEAIAVKSATKNTFDQRWDSIARSRSIIKKNVVSKNPKRSSITAKPTIATKVNAILDQPSGRL